MAQISSAENDPFILLESLAPELQMEVGTHLKGKQLQQLFVLQALTAKSLEQREMKPLSQETIEEVRTGAALTAFDFRLITEEEAGTYFQKTCGDLPKNEQVRLYQEAHKATVQHVENYIVEEKGEEPNPKDLEHLHRLVLGSSKVDSEQKVEKLGKILKQCKNVVYLVLNPIDFTKTFDLQELTKLQILRIEGSLYETTEVDCNQLPSSLRELVISGASIKELDLRKFTKLRKLHLQEASSLLPINPDFFPSSLEQVRADFESIPPDSRRLLQERFPDLKILQCYL